MNMGLRADRRRGVRAQEGVRDRHRGPAEVPGSYAACIGRLVAGCGRGDLAAMGRLYDETIGWVYPMACRVVPDDGAAAALTADAYQRIWVGSPSFDAASGCAITWIIRQIHDEFRAWLCQDAHAS